jgi:hypothetical protein
MSSEPLLSSIIPFAGSGLLGFCFEKDLKWMLIIVGFHDYHSQAKCRMVRGVPQIT